MRTQARSVLLAAMLLVSVVSGVVAVPVAAQSGAGTTATPATTPDDTSANTQQSGGLFDQVSVYVKTVINVVTEAAQAQESPETTQTDQTTDTQNQTRQDVVIDVSGDIEANNDVIVTVTRNGSPVEDATITVNGEPVGTTNSDGELVVTLSTADAELEAEFETDTTVLVQHKVLGGPDQDHSVETNQSRAVELAKRALSDDVDWTVERVHRNDGAGFFDIRFSGDQGERAKVRVDASSEVVFFLQEKRPLDVEQHSNVSITDYTVSNTTVDVNETVTVTSTVENTDDVSRPTEVTLIVDGETVESQNVTVASNTSETVTFETSFSTTGEHAVTVNDLELTNVTVEAQSQPSPNKTGQLTGTVTDTATGGAIANATVQVAETNVSATTDSNGTYTLDSVPTGTHTVIAQAEGYDSRTHEVTITANETTTQDFALNATVEAPNQTSVTFEEQTVAEGTVTVAAVTLADGGFVAIHDDSGAIVGVSESHEAGTHESVTIALEPQLDAEQNLTAVAHRDTNENGTFDFVASDGDEDTPYTVDNESVTDTATVSVEEEPTVTANRVDVVLDGAPNGLQTYSVTVTVSEDANATIESVDSEPISGEKLQIVEQTNSSVTFRAADLGDAVEPFDDSRVLATVNLSGSVTEEQVSVTVNQLTDDAGTEMNSSRVRLALEGELFADSLPGSAGGAPPTDPDGDGLYEDVDGDGDADFDDAISLAFVDYGALSTEQQAALDFNDDGSLTFADAIELAFQV